MKKRVFAIVPTVILCILLFYLIKTSQSPKSPYQNLTPVSGFSIQAVQARDTDNLLYIPSGETMNVDFFLTDYDQLSVGKYRIIFGLAHSNDFFYFPFDIVDS